MATWGTEGRGLRNKSRLDPFPIRVADVAAAVDAAAGVQIAP